MATNYRVERVRTLFGGTRYILARHDLGDRGRTYLGRDGYWWTDTFKDRAAKFRTICAAKDAAGGLVALEFTV